MKQVIENNQDWFLVSVILKFNKIKEKSKIPEDQYLVWENLHLIHAQSIDKAFDKAIDIGSTWCKDVGQCHNDDGELGIWEVCGIAELLPIYEDIEDGSELMWTNHNNISFQCISEMIKDKAFWEKRALLDNNQTCKQHS